MMRKRHKVDTLCARTSVRSELSNEVRSEDDAMPGTRAAVAGLCMFGLAACDDGGPGFVNASVRTITNARQVGVRLRSKFTGTHQPACPGRRSSMKMLRIKG